MNTESAGYALEGIVWSDFDRNGVRGQSEPVTAHTEVYLQAVIEPAGSEDALNSTSYHSILQQQGDYTLVNEDHDFSQTLVVSTDENGYYKATGLGVGLYKIWVGEEAATENAVQLHVGESDGVRSSLINLAAPGSRLFLPIAER